MSSDLKPKVAVIGGGVAGIVAAYLLQQKYHVTIFESNDYLGGHTNTVTVPTGPDEGARVDTGFIVLNDKTYPNFHRFLKKLGVSWRYSDMSFGFYNAIDDFQYAGTNLNGLFADRRNLFSRKFLLMLTEIRRFSTEALADLEIGRLAGITLGEYLANKKYSGFFIQSYLLPMGAAIWSAPLNGLLTFPAETLVRFFKNHGLLSFKDRPRWQTVVNGSQSYVEAFKRNFRGEILLNSQIRTIETHKNYVELTGNDKRYQFDYLILATHADEAHQLLNKRQELLSYWNYEVNRTVLHSDAKVMPSNSRAWASWNFRIDKDNQGSSPVSVTYHMNRLQGLETKENYFVTLNSIIPIDRSKVIKEILYTHPCFSLESIRTQQALNSLGVQDRIVLCGSYFGYGFHEDAVKSGLRVAKIFECEL